jgi:predicted PurR-regulated permease PerM
MPASARDVSARLIAKIVLAAAATIAALYLLYLVRTVIGLVLASIFFALAIAPAVNWLDKRRVPRALAILLVYLSIFASIFGIGLVVVPPIVKGVNQASKDLPGYVDDLRKNKSFRKYDNKYKITDKLSKQAEQLPSKLGDAAGTLRDVTVGVFSRLIALFSILVITFFLLMDGKRMLAFFYKQLPAARAERVRSVAHDFSEAISGYVFGNFVISILAGTVTYITLSLLNVPFALPLAILFGFFDLVPLVGATLGGLIVGVVVAFGADFPTALIIWAIVLVGYQQLENQIIQPVIYGQTVQLHPLAVIIAILLGATLMGILGALIAIPVAAGVQSILRDLYRYSKEGQDGEPGEGGAEPEPGPDPTSGPEQPTAPMPAT